MIGAPAHRDDSDVDVWIAPHDVYSAGTLAAVLPWLSAAERKRYHAFVFDRHRLEYLATRALVRTALSSCRAVAPADWQFHANAYGRPELVDHGDLRFNLSNNLTMIVCAIRRRGELGIDVEPLTRGPEIIEVADTAFAPAELAALRALPGPARADRAVSLWTLKEAYIKARGMGLSLPLDGFAFSFDAASRRISFAPSAGDPGRWQFRTLDLLGHRVALATEVTEVAPVVRVHRVVRLAATLETQRLADWPEDA
jgi:4'-phosphopantetheinyl transferase